MDKPYLSKVTFEFTQDGNADGTTATEEELIIEVEAPIGSLMDSRGYFVISSKTGWSVNNLSELNYIFTPIERIFRDGIEKA